MLERNNQENNQIKINQDLRSLDRRTFFTIGFFSGAAYGFGLKSLVDYFSKNEPGMKTMDTNNNTKTNQTP